MNNFDIWDFFLWLAIIGVVGGALLASVWPFIKSLMDDPKKLLKSLYGILFVGGVFLVSYLLAGNEVTANYINYNVTSPGLSKLVGAALTTSIIMAGVAVVGIIYSEINRAFKS